MKKLFGLLKSVRPCMLAASLLPWLVLFGCAETAHAQFIGYTSPQTVNQPVFSSQSCASSPLVSAAVQNVGQSVHIVQYALSFNAGSAQPIVQIIASADGTNYKSISDDGMSQNGFLVGYGVYAFIKVQILNGATGCNVSATYQGTSVSPQNTTGQQDVTAYQKSVFTGVNASINQFSATILPPYGNSGGVVVLNASAGGFPAGSSISVSVGNANNATGPTVTTYSLEAGTANAQTFTIPPLPTSEVSIQYVSGGTSSSTFNATYVFLKSGATDAPPCERSVVINSAAAGPTQIIAAAAGEQVRVCSVSVSSGTAESVDFQQGTGTNCGTGNSQLSGVYHLAANVPAIQAFPGAGLIGLPGNAVCVHLSGANQTDGQITYSDY